MRDAPKELSLKNLSMQQITERIHFLRDSRPVGMRQWAKAFRSGPTVQGEWQLGQQLSKPHRTLRG